MFTLCFRLSLPMVYENNHLFCPERLKWNLVCVCNKCAHFHYSLIQLISEKSIIMGWRNGLVVKKTCCSSRRTKILFSAHTCWLTTICNSRSGGSGALFWSQRATVMHVVHRHTYRQMAIHIINTHKWYNSFKHTIKHARLFVGSATDYYEETTSEFSLTQLHLSYKCICMYVLQLF